MARAKKRKTTGPKPYRCKVKGYPAICMREVVAYRNARKNQPYNPNHTSTVRYGAARCGCAESRKQVVNPHLRCKPGTGTGKYDERGWPKCRGKGNRKMIAASGDPKVSSGYVRCKPKPNSGACKKYK